jgi:hypothetical protein
MDSLAEAEATRHPCCLQLCPFSRRMGGNVAGNCDQNLMPRRAPTPLPVLLHASLKHLIGMEFGVLPQCRARKRGNKRLYRMAKGEVAGDEAASCLNGSLAIERNEKGIAQFAAVSR